METRIFNIDSSFVTNKYPGYKDGSTPYNASDFYYTIPTTRPDRTESGSIVQVSVVEPFNQKNVIEVNLLSIDYSLANQIPNDYFFLRLNDLGNIINRDTRYVAKILNNNINNHASLANATLTVSNGTIIGGTVGSGSSTSITISNGTISNCTFAPTSPLSLYSGDIINVSGTFVVSNSTYTAGNQITTPISFTSSSSVTGTAIYPSSSITNGINISNDYKVITNKIRLDQPSDIKDLHIRLEDKNGNLIKIVGDFSFTLELTLINNAILKDYEQIKFYSEPVMQRILQSKMLAYYEKNVDQKVNNSLTGPYNANLTNLNNIMEYTPNGNRGNYNFSQPSYFKNMDN